jgi:hypothetical protein
MRSGILEGDVNRGASVAGLRIWMIMHFGVEEEVDAGTDIE